MQPALALLETYPAFWHKANLMIRKSIGSYQHEVHRIQGQNRYVVVVKNMQTEDKFYFKIHNKIYAEPRSSYPVEFSIQDIQFNHDLYNEVSLHIKGENQDLVWKSKGNPQAKIKRLINLSVLAERAIISLKIIEYIQKVSANTFYTQHSSSIGERICLQLQQNFGLQFKNNKTSSEFKRLFNQYVQYNQTAFAQDRFDQGLTNQIGMTFFPTFVTQQIFNSILCLQKFKSSIIFGPTGIGKSFSYCLYYQLFKHFEQFLGRNSNCIEIADFIDHDLLIIPKVFYASLKVQMNVMTFKEIILSQIFIPFNRQYYENLQPMTFLQQIKKLYSKRKIKIVILIDQINLFYSLVRQEKATTELCIVLDSVKNAAGVHTIYSSSLTKEQFFAFTQNDRKFKINFDQMVNVRWWDFQYNQQIGIYETLNFLKFQNIRKILFQNFLKKGILSGAKSSQFCQNSQKIFQIKFKIDHDDIKTHSFPINFVQIRKFTQKKPSNFYEYLMHGSQNLFYDKAKSTIEELFTFHSQTIIKAIQNFFIKSNSKQQYALKLLVTLKILKIVQKNQYVHDFQRQNVINIRGRQILEDTISHGEIIDKCVEKNYFSYNKHSDLLTIHNHPQQLVFILRQVVFNSIKLVTQCIQQIFKQYFHGNGSMIGEFLDKSFARAVSSINIKLSINSTIIIIRHKSDQCYYFRDFLRNNFKIKKGDQEKYLPPKQEQINTAIKNEKLLEKDSAIKFVDDHFGPLLKRLEQQKLEQNQWIGAAPQSKQNFSLSGDSNKISTNSPSFDFLLIRQRGKEYYQVITFDVSIKKFEKGQLTKRLYKALRLSKIIRQVCETAGYRFDFFHVLLANQRSKKHFHQLAQFKNASKFMNLQMVESLQDTQFISPDSPNETLIPTFLAVAMSIAKKYQEK